MSEPRAHDAHASAVATAAEILLVRYGELGLKGGNRSSFERALVRNIRWACEPISPVRVERRQGRLAVFPERRVEALARRLQDVFGIASISPAWGVPPDPDAIAQAARRVLEIALAGFPAGEPITFRVRSSRGDKDFPLTSSELDRFVADRILGGDARIRVRLEDPALELGIDVRRERAYLFASRWKGPGGLPVGTLGRVLCLISGGIDSPVAAWLAMKRGCAVSFVTFHSFPFVGERAKKKVVDLVRVLARFQSRNRLFVVPFAEIQAAVRDQAPESYRTVLYRRTMQRIASRLAERDGALALVTGECIGQVASQTLENLRCIGAAASIPVLRPLATYDKLETVELARRIGTFAISAVQEPDCCTVFMPSRPVIRGREEVCLEAESRIDVAALVERALEEVETFDLAAEA